MTLDRKDYKSAIPQLEKKIEKLVNDADNGLQKFDILLEQAVNKINATKTIAVDARTSANGKNTIYYANSAPTGTNFKVDDIWFDTAHDSQINRWNGSSWVAFTLGDDAIGNLNASHINAGTIDASQITVSNLDASNLTSGTVSTSRIDTTSLILGTADGRHAEAHDGGFYVYKGANSNANLVAQLGYGSGNYDGGQTSAPYYIFGTRSTYGVPADIGNYSTTMGVSNKASGYSSVAEGESCEATGHWSHAEGKSCKANALNAHAGGWLAEAVNQGGFAQGFGVKTNQDWQTVIGKYNAIENGAFLVGNGSSSTRNTIFKVGWDGKIYSNGKEITVDYVSAQGDSGNWHYRKWNSGKFEAWYNSGSTTITTGTSSGNGWYRNTSEYTINMPSIGVSSIKHADITVTTDYANLITSVVHANTTYLGYYVSHLGSLSNETAYISAYVFGTWA